nr:unnamed protein product [Callosobruchus chinensis]
MSSLFLFFIRRLVTALNPLSTRLRLRNRFLGYNIRKEPCDKKFRSAKCHMIKEKHPSIDFKYFRCTSNPLKASQAYFKHFSDALGLENYFEAQPSPFAVLETLFKSSQGDCSR